MFGVQVNTDLDTTNRCLVYVVQIHIDCDITDKAFSVKFDTKCNITIQFKPNLNTH